MIRKIALVIPAVYTAIVMPTRAGAQFIPAPLYTDQITYNTGTGTMDQSNLANNPMSFSFAGGGVTAYSQTSNASGGTVAASASSTGFSASTGFQTSADANATLHYYIDLVGASGAPVPVTVGAHGEATGSGEIDLGYLAHLYGADVRFIFHTSDSTAIGGMASTSGAEGLQSFTVNQVAYLVPNTLYYVELFATAGTSAGYYNVSPTASAFVDPTFTIDPAYASLYSIGGVLTDAVPPPPVSGVPEPASWAMMILGFGLTGFALRRRQQVTMRVSYAT